LVVVACDTLAGFELLLGCSPPNGVYSLCVARLVRVKLAGFLGRKHILPGRRRIWTDEAHHVLQSSFSAWSCFNDFLWFTGLRRLDFLCFYDFPLAFMDLRLSLVSGFYFLAGNTLFTRRTSNEHDDCIFLSVCLLRILYIYTRSSTISSQCHLISSRTSRQ
jgi:hypothetical protein